MRSRPFIFRECFDGIVLDLDLTEGRMSFCSMAALVRDEICNRLAVATYDNSFAILFYSGEQTGKMCLGLVDIHSFHAQQVSPLSPERQETPIAPV